jgi:hypothetical protein
MDNFFSYFSFDFLNIEFILQSDYRNFYIFIYYSLFDFDFFDFDRFIVFLYCLSSGLSSREFLFSLFYDFRFIFVGFFDFFKDFLN